MHAFLYFVRWQLWPVLLSLPAHAAFVARGIGRGNLGARWSVAWTALRVHLRVRCGHNPAEALHVLDAILSIPPGIEGVVVECGCFLGGSTAKLSRAAAAVGRRLVVCDSFEGLPDVDASDHTDAKPDFRRGEYAGRLDLVRANVARHGRIGCTSFVPGWFEDSLAGVAKERIACAFWDVDLQSSFRTCVRELWPSLSPGARVYLHDVDRGPVVEVFTDGDWWRREVGTEPPTLVGAHRGLGVLSPLIGYVTKT